MNIFGIHTCESQNHFSKSGPPVIPSFWNTYSHSYTPPQCRACTWTTQGASLTCIKKCEIEVWYLMCDTLEVIFRTKTASIPRKNYIIILTRKLYSTSWRGGSTQLCRELYKKQSYNMHCKLSELDTLSVIVS